MNKKKVDQNTQLLHLSNFLNEESKFLLELIPFLELKSFLSWKEWEDNQGNKLIILNEDKFKILEKKSFSSIEIYSLNFYSSLEEMIMKASWFAYSFGKIWFEKIILWLFVVDNVLRIKLQFIDSGNIFSLLPLTCDNHLFEMALEKMKSSGKCKISKLMKPYSISLEEFNFHKL